VASPPHSCIFDSSQLIEIINQPDFVSHFKVYNRRPWTSWTSTGIPRSSKLVKTFEVSLSPSLKVGQAITFDVKEVNHIRNFGCCYSLRFPLVKWVVWHLQQWNYKALSDSSKILIWETNKDSGSAKYSTTMV
jgi:hypothetical protein